MLRNGLLRHILYTCPNRLPNVTRVQSATEWTVSVHTLHMSKPNVTRVQSATQWTASVHTLHMSKPNVTRVQSATQWTASVHTLHQHGCFYARCCVLLCVLDMRISSKVRVVMQI